jgi:hypothetical protein
MKRIALLIVVCATAATSLAPAARADFGEFELKSAGASLSTYQAGAHADFTTEFAVKDELGGGDVVQTRDVVFHLPPGLLGNPNGIPRCTMAQLSYGLCPQDSQVGLTEFLIKGATKFVEGPIYNMTPGGGDVVARFGFIAGFFPATVNVRVDPTDYTVVASVEGAAAAAALRAARTTIWGVPGSPVHDIERITPTEGSGADPRPPEGRPSSLPPAPFLSNPTRCGEPLKMTIAADSYQRPGEFSTREVTMGAITGCAKLSFAPTFTAQPTSTEAGAPTGLDVDIKVPQNENPVGLATSQMRDAIVTLPEGMTLAAGAAAGLASCDAVQAAYKAPGPAHCPDASKIGSAVLDVPALEHPLSAAVYQRTPEPGHLFRIWLIADELGAHVALPGEIELNPLTGQITSAFLENPQVPVREAKLHIFGGSSGPLANPAHCGTYATSWSLAPWSAGATASGLAPMTIDQGCGISGLEARLNAGTTDSRAGSYAPFVLDLEKTSGDQNLARLRATLPPGLLANLRGVELCEGSAAAAGNCPSGSQIGSVQSAVGPGSDPLWVPQPGKDPTAIFMGGPYEGAPYSMIVRVPAQAGPFDLGTVVARAAVRVNPTTAVVTVDSDPLPQLLQGVPIAYRRIHALVDRSGFTLNPTNCSPKEVRAEVTGSGGAVTEPVAGFQATDCDSLGFSPALSLRLKGGTRRTQHPALTAVLTQKPHQANNAKATVVLPPSEFVDQNHINNPCTRVEFAAEACPPGSILGTAEAVSPLLDNPLKGRVYFRSNGGERELPDIVVDLRGPIHIELVGFIDSVHKQGSEVSRIRTTFAHIPDAAVERFTMHLFGGKRGLLQNSVNLCRGSHRARIELRAQNEKKKNLVLPLSPPCHK